MKKSIIPLLAIIVTMTASATVHAGVLVNYFAVTETNTLTGQTATADFSFIDGTTLRIVLTETTTSTSVTEQSDLIATAIGFAPSLLPSGFTPVISGSTVVINSGSVSHNFTLGDLVAGDDVSGEWGATTGAKPNGFLSGTWFWVGSLTPNIVRFSGVNRNKAESLNGPEGGVSNIAPSTISELGYIRNSVVIELKLSSGAGLTSAQQTAFLSGVGTASFVEWGSDAAFGVAVPEPSSIILLVLGGFGLFGYGVRRRKTPLAA
ncbi:MAG: PEP-CTERM sorting domain-containing protein [Planctomycetes bacterium]|nr:PEP-CTERM sorting domain-containing protein [Planctomycetota bacterium]